MQCATAWDGGYYAHRLAQWAKVELLKEKVKHRLEAQYGKQLDKMADLIVEVVAEKAKNAADLEEKEAKLADAWEEWEGE